MLLLIGCGSDSTDDSDAGTDAGTDAGDDAGADDECTWEDTFDPQECPNMSSWPDCVVYVDAEAAEGGDGRSWATATPDLYDGLDLAACGEQTTELCATWQIWAAEGSYYAHRGCDEDQFWIRSNIALYGGFAGDESSLAERDPVAHATILDGRNGPDGEHHVWSVAIVSQAQNARLDGLTFTGGYTEIDEHWGGGGLGVLDGETTIAGCLFEGNQANNGGGLYTIDSTVELLDTVFRENVGEDGGGAMLHDTVALIDGCSFEGNYTPLEGRGGGIYIASGTSVQILETTFTDNSATFTSGGLNMDEAEVALEECVFTGNQALAGGALSGAGSQLTATGCTFSGNSAKPTYGGVGGALYLWGGVAEVRESTIAGNEASGWGGGFYLVEEAVLSLETTSITGNSAGGRGSVLAADHTPTSVAVTHCTFADNPVPEGDYAFLPEAGGVTIVDSILWEGEDEAIASIDAGVEITTSDVRGGWEGEGNIDADPLFVDPANGDYCLQAGSPCIGTASDGGEMGYCPYEGE